MNNSLSEKIDERSQLNSKLVELQTLQQELQSSSEVSRQTTLVSIPEKYEQEKLIKDLAKIAVENDIIMNGISFGAPVLSQGGQVVKTTINSNLVGSQSALLGFLRDVESNSRKILVNSITVQIGETEAGFSLVNFNVNMEAYYQGFI